MAYKSKDFVSGQILLASDMQDINDALVSQQSSVQTLEEKAEELEKTAEEQKDTVEELSASMSNVESTLSALQTDVENNSSAVSDVTRLDSGDGITVTYLDGSSKDITIEAGTVIDSWYQDDEGYLHLYDTDGNDIVDPVKIQGGSGTSASTSGTALITRVTSASTQCIYGDDCTIEYTFSALDASGDLVGSGTGTWYVGGVVKATSTVNQGANTFNIGSYLSAGSNTVKLSVSVDTGGESNTVVTKTWTVNAVNMYFEWSYDDSQVNTSAFTDRWTPYGDISKTTYTYIDGELLAESTTSRSGVAQSVTIPMQTHGSHMVERYVTATVNGTLIATASKYHDMIFVESGNTTPIIACSFTDSSMTQYNTVQIPVMIYTPSSLTSDAALSVNGEQVATWTGIDRTIHYWNYSPSDAGTKVLTITTGDVTKTITIEVEELDIDVEEVSGYDFRFKASEFATNDAVKAWESGNVSMTFSDNFDWTNGGLQTETDDSGNLRQFFCVKAGTTATINYELFGDDARLNGKNFKFIYKAVNCRNYDAQVLTCMDSGIGLLMQAQSATLKTEQNTLETITCKDDYIEFEFNIHPTSEYRYLSFLMDGCYDRLCLYAANDNMTHPTKQKIVIGSDDCDVYVYMVKAYPIYMTDDNICDNFIVDASNAYDMVDRYDRNDILSDSGEISPEKLYTQNPECRVFLVDVPRMTNGKKDTVTGCTVRQVYQAGGTSHCWNATGVSIKGQGTSSENYGDSARNMDFKFGDGFVFDDGTTSDTYAMSDGAIGINYMNFKLNVASSENCNNACIADWYNTFQPYISAARTNNSNARDTMEFHPCAVFIADASGELFGDTDYHLYGIGDCGNSKKNTDVFHDLTNKKECCIEVSNNTNEQCLMHSCDFSEETWDGNASFEFRYIWEDDDAATETATVLADAKQAWIDFVTWMCEHDPSAYTGEKLDEAVTFGSYTFKGAGTDNEVLAGTTISTYAGTYEYDTFEYRMAYMLEHCEEHMVMDSIVYHFVFIESMGMIDNVVKNTFWSTNDLVHWSLEKDYDNDTALGNDNEGGMTIPYGTETDDTKGDGHAFNGYDAVWATFVRELYDARARMYINRESAGCWDTEAFLTKLADYQDTRPERLWVKDTYKKYLKPYETAGTESYIDMLAGKKTHQRRQFKFYNEYYFSSCYVGSACTSQLVTVRCYTPETWVGVEPKNSIDLTMYANCYIVVKAASTTKRIRAERGETYTITFDEAGTLNDTETYFYLAPMIQKIGDMSHLYIGYCNFAYATLLQEISVGSSVEGYTNNNLKSIGFGNNAMLSYLQVQNCPNVASDLDLTGCQSLKTLLTEGSGFTGISIATGGLLETAHLPSPASLTLRELNYLDDFSMESYDNLTTLRIETCPTLDVLSIVEAAVNLNRLRLVGISWTIYSTDILNRLVLVGGLDESDYNTDVSVLTGYVYVDGVIRQSEIAAYSEAWQNLEVAYDSGNILTQYIATYVNWDDTVLYSCYVDQAGYPIDPVAEGIIDTPTKESDGQYDYVYTGFTNLTAVMTSNRTMVAQFEAVEREYTVKWYDYVGGTCLQTTTCKYGEEVVYEGDTPERSDRESVLQYSVFTGWDKSTGYIREDTTVYGRWETASVPGEGENIEDMSVAQLYALTRQNNMALESKSIFGDFANDRDRVIVKMGRDYTFDNVESYTLVEMGEDYVLDGTEDSVKEFDIYPLTSTDSGFTLMVDYEFTDTTTSGTLISVYDPSTSSGFRLYNSTSPYMNWHNATAKQVGVYRNRNVLVVRKKPGDSVLRYYSFNGTATTGYFNDSKTSGSMSPSTEKAVNKPVILGGYKYDTGDYESFGKGIIHFAKVWLDDLGAEVATDMSWWFREEWPMEYNGTARYDVADGVGGHKSNASFVSVKPAHYLVYMNSSSYNYGGWEDCYMRKWLNPTHEYLDDDSETQSFTGYGRFYYGLPVEWRFLLKKVIIPANSGYPQSSDSSYYTSTEVTIRNSRDYIYLGSYKENGYNITDTYYAQEGSYTSWLSSANGAAQYRLRAKFLGFAVPDDYTAYTSADEPVANENKPKLGDIWQPSGSTSNTIYYYVDKDFVEKYNLANTTNLPTYLTKNTSVGTAGILSDGGAWLTAYGYWLRSAGYGAKNAFWSVTSAGALGTNWPYNYCGVAPCFSI